MSARRLPRGARVGSFTRLSLRTLRARPLRSALTAGGIVLGVGMVFGVLLLVGTIHDTFGRLFDSMYGRTDIVLSGEQSVGSLEGSTIDRVRLVSGVQSASGSIGSAFRLVDRRGRVGRARSDQVYVAGEDYDQPETSSARDVAGRDPLPGRREIKVEADWAKRHHVKLGDRIRFSTPTGITALRVSGLVAFGGGMNLGGYGIAAMPIQDARRIMDRPVGWDTISIIVEPGTDVADVRARLQRRLGRGVEVDTPKAKSAEMQESLAALDIVLYFFSGIALFVGAFLILNSFNMTVLQRMREIGTLRALGASERRVGASILTEGLVVGALGSVGGLALGAGLAVVLLRVMQSWGLPVATIHFTPLAAVAALATGLLATLGGTLWPAIRAARVPPIQAMQGSSGVRRGMPPLRRALIGAVLFVPGMAIGGIFWFGDAGQQGLLGAIGGVGSTFAMFGGMVLLAPVLVLPLIRLMAWPLRRIMPAEGRLAADAVRSNPARTAATAATLIVALSVVVVNATVASSFVRSIEDRLDRQLGRDVTVQPLGYQDFGPPEAALSAKLRDEIAALPETGAVVGRRVVALQKLPGSDAPGLVIGYDPYAFDRVDRPDYEGAPRDAVLRGLANGGAVPSKTYAEAYGLHVGDRVTLTGPSSVRTLPIVGITDTLDGGGHALQVSSATIAAVYGVHSDVQLAVKARSPDDRAALAHRIDGLLQREYPNLEAVSNAQLKQSTTDAINQQFAFFNAIVAIAVLVGMLGIVNTLSMSVLERTREIGVLRAVGASRWCVRRTLGNESILISVAGTVAGLLVGLLVALVWIVGMRQSTFPGLALQLPTGTLVGIAILGVVIGVVAAVLPARRAARLDPLAALRYE